MDYVALEFFFVGLLILASLAIAFVSIVVLGIISLGFGLATLVPG